MSLQTDAATLCYSLYNYPDSPKVGWEYLNDGTDATGIYWAMVRLNGVLWIVYRGSVTKLDWERDFYTFYDPFLHDQLGPIHPGFYEGLPDTIQVALNFAKPNDIIGVTGHSLGAGRASLATGLLCIAKKIPAVRIVFGEPHSGKAELAQIVGNVSRSESYRADGGPNSTWEDVDLVTAVPPWFDVPGPRTNVIVNPPANDPWGVWRYHHMSGYAKTIGIQQTWSG